MCVCVCGCVRTINRREHIDSVSSAGNVLLSLLHTTQCVPSYGGLIVSVVCGETEQSAVVTASVISANTAGLSGGD